MKRTLSVKILFLGIALISLVAVSLACSSAATPTAAPQSTATSAAPTATAVPTATSVGTALPSPTATQAANQPVYGGTLRHAKDLYAKDLDPHHMNQGIEMEAGYAIYNAIVEFDAQGQIVPDLAQSWDFSSDGKAITFHLAQGVKFQDGSAYNAQVEKWNLERVKDPTVSSPWRTKLDMVSSITVVDDNTITLQLTQPWRPLLADLVENAGMVVSEQAVEKSNCYAEVVCSFGQNPVGTGPFKFVQWRQDVDVQLAKNPNYWQPGKPYLDKMVIQIVHDPTVQLAMLRTGETDIIAGVSAQDLPLIKRDNNLNVVDFSGGKTYLIRLAVDQKPFDNKALRVALTYATDRQKIIDAAYGGSSAGRPAYTHIGSGWAYNPDINPYPYNLAMAKQKLAEAGYPNGVTFDYPCRSDTADMQICEVTQAMYAEAGIHANIVPIDPSQIWSMIVTRKISFTDGNRTPKGDPHIELFNMFYSTGKGGYTGYNNPQVDQLMDQAGSIYDISKAKPLYDQIQTLVAQDAPVIWEMYGVQWAALNNNVQGFQWIPDLWLRLADSWLKQ